MERAFLEVILSILIQVLFFKHSFVQMTHYLNMVLFSCEMTEYLNGFTELIYFVIADTFYIECWNR